MYAFVETGECQFTYGVNLMTPGHQTKVVIEDTPGPDYGGRETGQIFDCFLEFVEFGGRRFDGLLEQI